MFDETQKQSRRIMRDMCGYQLLLVHGSIKLVDFFLEKASSGKMLVTSQTNNTFTAHSVCTRRIEQSDFLKPKTARDFRRYQPLRGDDHRHKIEYPGSVCAMVAIARPHHCGQTMSRHYA